MTRTPRAPDLSRTRLVVVQVLVVSLIATLFVRLWYLQVVSGDVYQAQAAENAVRDVSVSPQRGLIVDAMGRPLAASRQSWVLSVDRTALAELTAADRRGLLHRVAGMTHIPLNQVRDRLKLCGERGAPLPPRCWNGSPYQPVTVAEDVPQRVAVSVQERSEDFPALVAERQTVRYYPAPFGVNAAHLLGYLSPITGAEYERAEARDDDTLTASSLVGRSGVEREYDRWLRGVPGTEALGVDSLGRVLGLEASRKPVPGSTLVTSIDSRVQAVVERELRKTILTARKTVDEVTERPYEATSGAAVVLDPDDGRVVAMASYPTYDPKVWVGGISERQLDYLYDKKSGEPLLARTTQAQLAPGSTFKPFMALGALSNGYTTETQLECSSSFTVGNRSYQNFESGAYGPIDIERALQVSCNTFFYRVGYALWLASGGDDAPTRTLDPLVEAAKGSGFGSPTGIDVPGEASGRIADRRWKMQYWKENKDYYCRLGEQPGDDYLHVFAREFCVDGYAFRAGDAVNFVIGQGDTIITPLQLAVAYGAIANGGTLWAPRIGKAILSPDGEVLRRIRPEVQARMPFPKADVTAVDQALQGTPIDGTLAWKMGGFPLDQVELRAKTGTAEVYGKQTTSWLATYDQDFVVVMMVEQGGTGSGTSGDSMRRIWEALYGIDKSAVHPAEALIPGTTPPHGLPTVDAAGLIDPPPVRDTAAPGPRRPGSRTRRVAPRRDRTVRTTTSARRFANGGEQPLWRQVDWLLVGAVLALLVLGMLLVWSATLHRDDLTQGDPAAYLRRQAVNAGVGLVLAAVVASTDHRWLRGWAPVVYLASVAGLALIFVPGVGATVNGSHSWLMIGGLSLQPAEFAKVGVVLGMALVLAERTEAHLRRGVNAVDVVPALLIAAVPAVLILAQPDLGTLMVLLATVLGVVGLSGAPKRWLLVLVGGGAAVIVAAVQTGLLESYQLLRFQAFTDPSLDPRGAGYNTMQARIAIGNGGVTGQGLFEGTQTQSGFVPEQHTDFVFTVAGEELGLAGAAAIVGLFAVLLWRALQISRQADDLFGRLAAAGIACWFGFQVFQNIGMCLGIMPVTGVPLPLVSYGGTSMFASLTAVGLLLNIQLRTRRREGHGVVVRSRLARSRF